MLFYVVLCFIIVIIVNVFFNLICAVYVVLCFVIVIIINVSVYTLSFCARKYCFD